MLKKTKHSILFQGHLKKNNYFEGWYYKQVTADGKISLSFIPGVSLNEKDKYSFIQYILVEKSADGSTQTTTGYVRFPIEAFHYQNRPFKASVGESIFSEISVYVDFLDKDTHFKGHLKLGALHPIQVSPLQPNIMGIFGYIPKMECYHGVISMQHTVDGVIRLNKRKIDFSGGKGYIEKDWGTSFPKQYIWLHSNHFKNNTASLFFSIAHIPFHFTEFEGFICNLVIGDTEYRFATYNLSSCNIVRISNEEVVLRLENKQAFLEIQATILDQGELIAPLKGTMQKTIKEGIAGIVHVRLEDKESNDVFEDTGTNAGVEIVDYL